MAIMSATARRRQDHLVAAGLERDLLLGPVEAAPDLLLPSRRARGRCVGTPTQAEPLPSAVRPTRLTAPVGCACDRRSPVELPRYKVSTSISANPARTASRARGPLEGARERGEDAVERARVGLLGRQGEGAPAAGAPSPGSTSGEGVLGRRRGRGVGQGGVDHLGDAVGPDHAGAACGARPSRRRRRSRSRPARAGRRWSSWCSARSARRRGCPRPPARCSRPRRRSPARARPCSMTLLRGDHAVTASTPSKRAARTCSASRLRAGVEDVARRARAPTGSRGRPAPPGRAGPCRS